MHPSVNPWMILPFAVLLGCIAIMPLLAHEWWERHYPKVVLVLSLLTLGYYLVVLKQTGRPLESAHDYFSFICLTGALFVVSGGILIRVKGESTPLLNTLLLGFGAVLANLIGTTGASMVLIRPYLRANKYRITSYHVVFFIFIVSNVGGALTPIGDPPLYLGFLKGIPFMWTLYELLPMWSVGVAWLLVVFFIVDTLNFRRAPESVREKETENKTWKIEGLPNIAMIGLILWSLFIQSPMFLREIMMIIAMIASRFFTDPEIYERNDFSWKPVREVAILFAGIFMTMMPALDWLEANARGLGIHSVSSFYWGSGSLSSVLDNAPTYLNFLSAAGGIYGPSPQTIENIRHIVSEPSIVVSAFVPTPESSTADFITHHNVSSPTDSDIQIAWLLVNYAKYIAAISIGAVFFGACTYIGNGPNFMVKSIAEHAGVKVPSFFGFIFKFTLPILLPMLVAVWWLFFRAS